MVEAYVNVSRNGFSSTLPKLPESYPEKYDYAALRLLLALGKYDAFLIAFDEAASNGADSDWLILAGAQYLAHTKDNVFEDERFIPLLNAINDSPGVTPASVSPTPSGFALSSLFRAGNPKAAKSEPYAKRKPADIPPDISCVFPWGVSGIDTADWGELKRILLDMEDEISILADIRLGNHRFDDLSHCTANTAALGFAESFMQSHFIEPRAVYDVKPYGRWMEGRVKELSDRHNRTHFTGGAIYLCPAVPDDADGGFRLYADGGYIVECSFERGIPVKAAITSKYAGQCLIRNPWVHGAELVYPDGSHISFSCGAFFEFDVQAGETYILTGRKPSCSFETFAGADDFIKEGKQRLTSLIWPSGRDMAKALAPELIQSEKRENYTLDTIAISTRPGRRIEYLLSIPREEGAFRLLLGIHGHEADWGVADAKSFDYGSPDDFCAYFADRGYMVLHPPTMDHTLCDNNESETLYGYWINDILCCVDDVLARRLVKDGRYCVIGLSTGAGLAAHVTSMDDRVYACVSSGFFITMRHEFFNIRIPPNCSCGVDYALAEQFTTAGYYGLCAPKNLLVMHGRRDRAMYPGYMPDDAMKRDIYYDWWKRPQSKKEFDEEYAFLKQIYKNRGYPDNVEAVFHDGAHSVDNRIAYEWIEKLSNHI